MKNTLSQKNGHLIKYSTIGINSENLRPRSAYIELKDTSTYILKTSGPYFIKSDISSYIYMFFS